MQGFQSPCKPFEYRPLIYYLIWSVFCMQMQWWGRPAVGLRVEAAVVLVVLVAVAVGGGAHTLVVCIMRFPGSSLRCVRDPKSLQGMEKTGAGGAKGEVAGKRSPEGKIPRCSARLPSSPRLP